MDKFEGFPAAGFEWLRKLAKNNNRPWFEKHKQEYLDNLQAPALAMVVELGERLKAVIPGISYEARPNGGSLMRIYRDIRFSKDKTPYKTHIGINWWEGPGKGGTGFHFFMDTEGAVLYAGHHDFDKPFLAAYREAVADDRSGRALQQAIDKMQKAGAYEVGGEQLKRVPPGFEQDHPRGDLLRYKGLWVRSPTMKPAELGSPKLIDTSLKHCRAMLPVHKWFAAVAPA